MKNSLFYSLVILYSIFLGVFSFSVSASTCEKGAFSKATHRVKLDLVQRTIEDYNSKMLSLPLPKDMIEAMKKAHAEVLQKDWIEKLLKQSHSEITEEFDYLMRYTAMRTFDSWLETIAEVVEKSSEKIYIPHKITEALKFSKLYKAEFDDKILYSEHTHTPFSPKSFSEKSPYDLLEISSDASPSEIKLAYQRAAMKWHPDRNSDPNAAERFIEIKAAYETLK